MKYFNKKFIILTFLALVMFSAAPKTVFAAVPVFETNKQLLGDTKTTATFQKKEQIQQLTEWKFKLVMEVIKRRFLNMIVDQIVNWIQGGGKPKFITNWPAFFQDAVDQAGGDFLKQLGLGLFCSPYNLTLRAAFIPIPRFSDRSSCTLSQIGVNLDNFLKNFNNGGWVAWNEMILKPQNNIYGAYLMAWDEYEIEKSAAAKAAEAEAQASRGFLSAKKCIRQHQDATGTVCDEYQIVTPGAVVGDLAAKAVGSDIDAIVNAQDLAAYIAAITNALLNRMFSEGIGLLHMGSSSSGGGGGPAGCDLFINTPAYADCVAWVSAGKDVRQFMKNYLIDYIALDLGYQGQLLSAKQKTLVILNQSLSVLTQLETCLGYPLIGEVKKVKNAIKIVTKQISDIQSDIIARNLKKQQIEAVTDLTQIPPLFIEVTTTIFPAITEALATSAQAETSQSQIDLENYQQQLSDCLAHKPRADIKANGSDGPITIPYNTGAIISWTSGNLGDGGICTIYPNGWVGLSGTQFSGNLTAATTTFDQQCSGPNGTAEDKVIVNVNP